MKSPNGPPGYVEFFGESYNQISRVMRAMTDHPLASPLPTDVMLTALACACVRATALTVAAIDIPMEEVEHFSKQIVDEVKRFHDEWDARP